MKRIALVVLLSGCSAMVPPSAADAGVRQRPSARRDSGFFSTDAGPPPAQVRVLVRLDGRAAAGVVVGQGGTARFKTTDAEGMATLMIDATIEGDLAITASHPDARINFARVDGSIDDPLVIDLIRFDTTDNSEYLFEDPGEPERRPTTLQCAHCHITINEDWFASPHRTSASNPIVHDQYAGTAHPLATEAQCVAASGRWEEARAPGGGRLARCFLGDGLLQNAAGCSGADCLEAPIGSGHCADCHAPAIDGVIGGRDLLEAEGFGHRYGVSCGVCHRVEAVLEEQPPGVAGSLVLLRPTEEADPTLGAGGFLPLTFGPGHDTPNIRMGSVQRDHFESGEICAGCHQYDQRGGAGLPTPDPARWPDGRLPVHSTYEEWRASPFEDAVPCNSCHMPPDPDVANSADLQEFSAEDTGITAGWLRPPGAVRRHAWYGPRQPESGLIELAAALFVTTERNGDEWTVRVRTVNRGCGHALPTGEPQRQVLLVVRLRCDSVQQPVIGGDVLPAYAGAAQMQLAGADWGLWRDPVVGDRIRVVRRPGGFVAYEGFGAFSGDAMRAEEKGIRIEEAVGEVLITGLAGGRVVTTPALPEGDIAYLIHAADPSALAGAPGVGFARLLSSADGRLGVHHSVAVDMVSDNRLMPQAEWSSSHRFRSSCEAPRVQARLFHRDLFYDAAAAKSWPLTDRLLTEVWR